MIARLLGAISWPEWRHHPWRHGAALLAIALGVALAFSVQLINGSALAEFAGAVRQVNGEPDLVLVARQREGFDDAVFAQAVLAEGVALASPVVEFDLPAQAGTRRASLRVLGVDALRVGALAPALQPRLPAGADTTALLEADAAWANPAAREALGLAEGDTLQLPSPGGPRRLRLAGSVAAAGAPLLVIDIATAQSWFGFAGRLSRIDLRLAPGVPREAVAARLAGAPGVLVQAAEDREQRVSNLSRAYRVNLTVLALVALFVGGFLVYSVVALSVAQRTASFALLGVLGLGARERRALVLAETALLGAAGSGLGLALGSGLAAGALRLLGGDLGGGYFPGVQPVLRWSPAAAAAYGGLGIAAALLGAWWPARQAQALAPAQALKGLGALAAPPARWWPALALLALGGVLAALPPVAELPIPAYASVAALLAGGVAAVPAAVGLLLARWPASRHPLWLLALQRARFARQTASAAVAGVVASLALSVALTVMVASFREAVTDWLGAVLPAELYLRSSGSANASDLSTLPAEFATQVATLHGVARVQPSRLRSLVLAPQRPAVALIARPLADPARELPLLAPPLPPRAGETGVYLSEPAASIYGLAAGATLTLPLPAGDREVRVLGIWRDYARQFGAIAIDSAAWRAAGGDDRINDLAIWLEPGADRARIVAEARALAGPDRPLDSADTAELRRLSLAIFDRSFAVTRYLQAVAIAVGLVGIAASLSAQVLARRREFGLLRHLGLTRRQVVFTVTGEAAVWLAAGVAIGLALGIAISAVLVYVVNPQSFHWTMPLRLPPDRLASLAAAVLLAGVATAAFSVRRAAAGDAVQAVKEDW